MAIDAKWDNPEHTVFLITVEGKWSLDDYYIQFQRATDMLNSINRKVMLILDLSRSSAPPSRFVSTGRFAQQHQSPNIMLTIITGAPAFAQALATVMLKLFPNLGDVVTFADTLDEARQVAYKRLHAVA